MKHLRDYINESLQYINEDSASIKNFILQNYFGVNENEIIIKGKKVYITGNLYASQKLKSLNNNGAFQIEEVGGDFQICDNYNITTLEGCPKIVKGNCLIEHCTLIDSLKGCPEEVGYQFTVDALTSLFNLDYLPKTVGSARFYLLKYNKDNELQHYDKNEILKKCNVRGTLLLRHKLYFNL